MRKTLEEYPGIILASHEGVVKKDLGVLPGESWSWTRHAYEEVLGHCGHFKSLKRFICMIALESAKKLLGPTKRFDKANEDEGTAAARVAAGKAMGGKAKGKGKDGGKPRLNRLDPCKNSLLESDASKPSLSGNKTSSVLFCHEWCGWGAIFNAIVLLQGKSQFATFLSNSIVNVFSQWQSRQRRVPIVDGRSRARHRRALIRDLVRTGSRLCSQTRRLVA